MKFAQNLYNPPNLQIKRKLKATTQKNYITLIVVGQHNNPLGSKATPPPPPELD